MIVGSLSSTYTFQSSQHVNNELTYHCLLVTLAYRTVFFTIQRAYKYHKLWGGGAIPLTSPTPIFGGHVPPSLRESPPILAQFQFKLCYDLPTSPSALGDRCQCVYMSSQLQNGMRQTSRRTDAMWQHIKGESVRRHYVIDVHDEGPGARWKLSIRKLTLNELYSL